MDPIFGIICDLAFFQFLPALDWPATLPDGGVALTLPLVVALFWWLRAVMADDAEMEREKYLGRLASFDLARIAAEPQLLAKECDTHSTWLI
eukprot:COSAG02_NODE_3962_length_5981_cov_104.850731_4_plen_92_part_00